MNIKELKEMIALMNEHQLTELEIDREGTKIRLVKGGIPAVQVTAVPSTGAAAPAVVSTAAAPAPEEGLPPGTEQITAPMVGTFYSAPSPDSPPFIQEGQSIEVDQILCIIEAMKLMNEIKAEVNGRIVQVLVENGQAVEFGEPLFLIAPSVTS